MNEPSKREHLVGAPAQSGPQTRFGEFDDVDHPFNIWWQKHGQFMMSGSGRKQFIWACRGWIAREQLAEGVEVTGDSLHETKAAQPGPGCQECGLTLEEHDDPKQFIPFPSPAQGTPEPPKVEEIVSRIIQRCGLTEKFRYVLPLPAKDFLTELLRPYFPHASQTPIVPESLRLLWDDLVRLEEIVESHDHQEFDSCDVCGERGQYRIAKSRYETEAVRYVDHVMRAATPASQTCLKHSNAPAAWCHDCLAIAAETGKQMATPASTAQTDGWVSVEDRLPEPTLDISKGEGPPQYLCFTVVKRITDQVVAEWSEKKFWDYGGTDITKEVTHWRELPAAPGSVPQAPHKCALEKDGCGIEPDSTQGGVPQAEPPKEEKP
jgi:Protein of unknown function (DUF551)